MPAKKRKSAKAKLNRTQLDPFAAGGIAALSKAGYSEQQIVDSKAVSKPGGAAMATSWAK